MPKLLFISASPSPDSTSRKTAIDIIDQLKKKHAGYEVIERDLGKHSLPHFSGAMVDASFIPKDQRSPEQNKLLQQSDQLVQELIAAEIMVIATPMWNFSLPSGLKAWIDHIVRADETFSFTEQGPKGLLPAGKKVYFAISSGGIYSQGPAQSINFVEPYLKAVLGFLGITDFKAIYAEGTAMGPDAIPGALKKAHEQISKL